MTTVSASSPASVETQVQQMRAQLQRGQLSQVLQHAKTLATEVPENRDVLYLIAVSQRYLGRAQDALATLAQFAKIHPDYGRLHQERGHCLRGLGDVDGAIAAYREATLYNSALPASWRALAELCEQRGPTEEAQAARGYLQYLSSLPPPIVTATSLFCEGEWVAAESIVRDFLRTHGDHVEAMRLLAQIGMKLDVLDDAELLLDSALILAPDYVMARYDYGLVLSQRHKHGQALEQAQLLLKADPSSRQFRTFYASVCVGLGDHESALRTYRELLAETPQNPELHLSVAHALKTIGRQQEAIASYWAAAAVRPDYGDAYWSLANLKTYRFSTEQVDLMASIEATPPPATADRYHLCFALGKALEDKGDYARSFEYYARGNALKKVECRYDPSVLERNLALQKQTCTAQFFSQRVGYGHTAPDPIFIVGLPRAGSTLLEQILASHPRVEGTMELADIPRLVQLLNGREQVGQKGRYPAVLRDLTADQARELGEKFMADTRVYRTGRAFFIDKMPNNFRHIGLIHLILPNAKIIDARREPMACCFSNFKQLFASGQEFTYSLEDIGRYYRAYVDLMAHWDAVLPGKVLRVLHEDVLDDLEASVRRILDYCGLDFDPACVEFHKTRRSVRTASSEQVRRPINRDGVDQWRPFAAELAPLRTILGPLATTD